MFEFICVLFIGLSNLPRATPCVAQYGQCGGTGYTGSKECCLPSTCQYNSDYYSQCLIGTTVSTRASSSVPSTLRSSSECNAVYGQCGGQTWTGATCCTASTCTHVSIYYSQCLPMSTSFIPTPTQTSTLTTKVPTTTIPSTQATAQGCSAAYAQCGGIGWTGPIKCCNGSTCTINNNYYSQCIPIPGASTSSITTANPITSPVVNDGRQNGVTTRYWDCCKASCGWQGKASVSNPVKTCADDGVTSVGVNTESGCNGGTAYMCNNQLPWNISSTLSYGYAAVYGKQESDWCCACYSLIFTSGPVVGKELIVQATNTGGDLGNNHFDLQMPGGGVGIFNGCSKQFPSISTSAWGDQYGGVHQRSDCNSLPAILRAGCFWRFDWFMNADNPTMRFQQVTCPLVLTANTQCVRT